MRITILLSHFDFGGAQRVSINLANGLVRSGYEVDVVAIDGQGALVGDIDHSVNIVDLGHSSAYFAAGSYIKYLRSRRPDIIYSAQTHVNIFAIIFTKLMSNIPVIISEHSHLSDRTKDKSFSINRLLVPKTYGKANEILAVSESIAEDLARTLDIDVDKIKIVPNAAIGNVDDISSNIGHDSIHIPDDPYILTVGRLEERKSFHTLINAYDNIADATEHKLVIAGDGPQKDQLEKLSAEKDLKENIILPGFVDNPYILMQNAAVFVLSSETEGLPTVLIEAMASGCPVVATNCTDRVPELLSDSDNAIIVQTNEPNELADGIKIILERNKVGNDLRRRAESYSVENVINIYDNIFEKYTKT